MDDYGRSFFRRSTAFFAASTVALNVTDAWMVNAGLGRVGASLAAVLMPVALLLATEGLIKLLQAPRRGWGDGVPLAIVGTGAVVGAVMSFAGSFAALSRLGSHWHWEHPAFLPAAIDTLLVTMAAGGVWAARRIARDAVVDDPATTSTTATDELVVAEVSTTPATDSSTPVDDPAASGAAGIDELPPPTLTSVTDDPGELVSDDPSSTSRQAAELVVRPVNDPTASGDELTDEYRRVDPDDPTASGDELTDELATTAPTNVTDDPGELVADGQAANPTSAADDLDDECSRRARRVLAASQIAADADELATVLRMADEGASKQAIADSVGRSRSTVSGWLRVAGEAPTLAAVR